MARPRAEKGQLLDGRFRLIEEIGHGGMSTVFKAEDLERGGEIVAVKIPLLMFASGVGAWSLFQREEEIGRRLDHPYVLRFLPLAADKRRSYVVTEYVPGRPLSQHLREHEILTEAEALAICSRLCDALEHVHRSGVVHYDVKPANIILCPDGSIRLIDFGLAHAAAASRFALMGRAPAIGSSGYVAPEQVQRRAGRPSADIYGVGAILYELLTGAPPFGDDDPFVVASARLVGDPPAPRRSNPDITRETEEIILRALRRDPAGRYQSASAMKADLDHPERVAVSGLSDRLRPVTPWRRRWRLVRYLAFVGMFPVVAQVVLFGLLWHHLASRPSKRSTPSAYRIDSSSTSKTSGPAGVPGCAGVSP